MAKPKIQHHSPHVLTPHKALSKLPSHWTSKFHCEQHKLSIQNTSSVSASQVTNLLGQIASRLSVHSWKHTPQLTLCLTQSNQKLNDKGLKALALAITRHFNHLRHLTIDFQGISNFTTKGLQVFSQVITRSLRTLKGLTLRVSYLADKELRGLCALSFGSACKLDKFSISLRECDLASPKTLPAFSSSMAKISNRATNLRFYFDTARDLTETQVNKFISQLVSNYTDLRRLSIGFSSCFELSMTSLSTYIASMNSLKHLKEFALAFKTSLNDETSATLGGLVKSVSEHLPGLEGLTLDFEMLKIGRDKDITISAEDIAKNLVHLKNFKLRMAHCNLNNIDMHLLAFEISQYLGGLSKLDLDFSGNYEVFDAGVSIWGSELGTGITGLKDLTLRFSLCPWITDAGIKDLNTNLEGRFAELEALTVDLRSCSRIGEAAKKEVSESLAHVKKLMIL